MTSDTITIPGNVERRLRNEIITVERRKVVPARLYGCHNKPRPTAQTSYVAQSGWLTMRRAWNRPPLREATYVIVAHVMSTDCRYDASATDRGCAGCRHRNGADVQGTGPC